MKPPVAPMLAKVAAELPRDGGYAFEPKWDGFRAIVFREGAGAAKRSAASCDHHRPEPTRCL